MTAPDRPTREQVDATLARVDRVHVGGSNEVRQAVHVLAAEVRALRAEYEPFEGLAAQECAAGKHSEWLINSEHNHAWCQIERLRAALVARTPRSAEEIEQRFAYMANLDPDWDSYGAERIGPAVIATARSVLAALTAPVHICGTVHGGIQLAWDDEFVTMEVNPGDRLSASVGEMYAEPEVVARTPQPVEQVAPRDAEFWRLVQAGYSYQEAQRRSTLTGAAPPPAVPDGEDEPDWHNMRERLHTEIGAIVGVTPRDERTGDADGDLIEMVRRAVWAPSPATAPDGERVPARLDAAAEALEALHSHGLGYELRQVADQLRDGDGGTPELRAAVAAALALPTETQK